MARPKLPIGIQSFVDLREGNFAYADKTPYIARMAAGSKAYFLSRPRRFGKSLLVDTLDCAFTARRELFEGLFLDSPEAGWNWERKHPVLRISFGGAGYDSEKVLLEVIGARLDEASRRLSVPVPAYESPGLRLGAFIQAIEAAWNEKVVVLVDEYDKPILDNLEKPALALAMRDMLKGFYSALKDADPYLRLVFLTGVSKFAKTGVFSGLNNLNDITLDRNYSAVCGYTQNDMDTLFGEWLADFDREMAREWYNGYAWLGETVYNPFDALLLFDKGDYRSWWFETGTPAFLIRQWQAKPRALTDLDNMIAVCLM